LLFCFISCHGKFNLYVDVSSLTISDDHKNTSLQVQEKKGYDT